MASMLSMNDIRKGVAVVLDDEPYAVVLAEFLKKQQRRPVVRATLKHLRTGRTREHTFMQSDKIQVADIERKPYQFLYVDGGRHVFMDQETYEQVELGDDVVGETAKYFLEGQVVELLLFGGTVVTVDLPIKIERRVTVAPPGIKGDTSTNVMKEVVVEGGARVKAPLFVKEGDVIRIDTRTGDYVDRVVTSNPPSPKLRGTSQ